MNDAPAKITLDEWGLRREALLSRGWQEPEYGGPLARHFCSGDLRLRKLRFDNSAASLRLWQFLLSEEERLHAARERGDKIVGVMKDLGTVAVIAWSMPGVCAFYPDGVWWTPCLMENSDRLLQVADRLGVGEQCCPVRAMLAAFATKTQFPTPDLLLCSAGAVCDDFSAIAQRIEAAGSAMTWWEAPRRRRPEAGELAVELPGGFTAPATQVAFVQSELLRVCRTLEQTAQRSLSEALLADGIREANRVRRLLAKLRRRAFTARRAPLPALETMIAEMLAVHFCSNRQESQHVLGELLREVDDRIQAGTGVLGFDAARIFWVNPVADLHVMNILEDVGGRLCGTDFLFCHALDEIPENIPRLKRLHE